MVKVPLPGSRGPCKDIEHMKSHAETTWVRAVGDGAASK
jgi:hypothetical protein